VEQEYLTLTELVQPLIIVAVEVVEIRHLQAVELLLEVLAAVELELLEVLAEMAMLIVEVEVEAHPKDKKAVVVVVQADQVL
jgi:hypothetical protein